MYICIYIFIYLYIPPPAFKTVRNSFATPSQLRRNSFATPSQLLRNFFAMERALPHCRAKDFPEALRALSKSTSV